MSEPLIVGIRHHSPACARLVKSLIESQRPRYVLIEGPADYNDRVDELFLAHQLPVAIYSYCQYQDGAAPGVVPGRHLLNFRRSGRRYKPLVVFRHKLTSSICLAGRRVKKRTIRLIRMRKARPCCCMPPAWITATPCGITCSKMKASKLHYPLHWRTILPTAGRLPGDALNRQREAFMARWIAWAMQQNNGDVLVVCGGWHAPALAKCGANARKKLTSQNCRRWQMPLQVAISRHTVKSALMCCQDTFQECLPRSGKTGAGGGACSRQVNNY